MKLTVDFWPLIYKKINLHCSVSSSWWFVTAEQNMETFDDCAHFYFCSVTSVFSVRKLSERIPEISLSKYPTMEDIDFGSERVLRTVELWRWVKPNLGYSKRKRKQCWKLWGCGAVFYNSWKTNSKLDLYRWQDA